MMSMLCEYAPSARPTRSTSFVAHTVLYGDESGIQQVCPETDVLETVSCPFLSCSTLAMEKNKCCHCYMLLA